MSLKTKIAERLKAKATGVNLSQKRIDAIATKVDAKITTEEEIDAQLDLINEYTPFTEMAQFDDYERGKAAKIAAEKEAKRLADIEAGKKSDPVNDPAETPTEKLLKQLLEQNKALVADIATIKGEKVIDIRKQSLAQVLKDAPEAYRNKALKDLSRMNFESDEAFNEYLTEAETDFKELDQTLINTGLGKDRPLGSLGDAGKKAPSKEEVQAVVDNIM